MAGQRVRLTLLADEVGIVFYDLFCAICRTLPKAIDMELKVSAELAAFIRESRQQAAA